MKRRWLRRIGLFAASLVATLLLLELVVRVFFPMPEPRLFRDGIYLNTLPLVNGRMGPRGEWDEDGATVPDKVEGELRVVVFGESSTEGCPWGHKASPATMIHDQLAAALPDRKVTMINMGRTGSYSMDAYYYLVSIARYEPDVVLFYLGVNDSFETDREMCMPSVSPGLHATWRWLAEHSYLLWTTRVLGPQALGSRWSKSEGGEAGSAGCVEGTAFQAWTDVLVNTAHDMGAEVLVVHPVASASMHVDWDFHKAAFGRDIWERPAQGEASNPFADMKDALGRASGMHRELLLCQLDMACDPAPLLERYLRGRPEDDSEGEGVSWDGYESMDDVDPQRLLAAGADTLQVLGRGRAWRGSVEAVDGHFINFFDRLAEVSERGLFQAPLMVDEVHLSAEGYWFLASLCSAEILAMQGEAIPDDLRVTGRNPTVPERYREGELDVLLHHGLFHLRKRMPYLAGGILRMAVERHGSAEARRRLAWMREALGAEPMLPPEHGVVPTTAELEETCRSEPGCW